MELINWKEALARARASLKSTTTEEASAVPAPSYTVPDYTCPLCQNVGFVYKDEEAMYRADGGINPNFGKSVSCACRRATWEDRRRAGLMQFCNLPEDAGHMTFENFQTKANNQEALNAALEFLSGGSVFYSIIGPVDTGKTHIAVAICQEYINLGIPAKFAFTPDMLIELRDTFNKDAEYSYLKLYRRYCEVPLLVLDDIYANKTTEWTEETLTSLINARYMNKKPTIFTSNKALADMNDRIASRLQREKWCRVVILS